MDDLPDIATADDVAALAGVSRWTVTRAFKPEASISDKSRKKVMDAAEQLGYAPDLLASSLASDRSHLVSILLDEFTNPQNLVMIETMTRALRRSGWDTILVNTYDGTDANGALLNSSQRRVDAAVLIGNKFNDQLLATALGARRSKRLVIFGRQSDTPKAISICCDDHEAMTEMADHVWAQGFRRPLFLGSPQCRATRLFRREGFLSRWRTQSGETPAFDLLETYSPVVAEHHVRALLQGWPRADWPDVLVCETDAIAIGASDALQGLGAQVPQEIGLTGFDDVAQAASPHYRLTTYQQPISEMVEALVGLVRGDILGETLPHFRGRLIVRDSTRART